MNSVRDLPLGIKEQDSLNEEAGLTATVTGAPEFGTVTGHDAQPPPQFIRPNFDRMPIELKRLKNWLLWAAVWNGSKWTKRLYKLPVMGRARLTQSTGHPSKM